MRDYTPLLSPLDELRDCTVCPRECHADRFSRHLGWCRSDAGFNIASICNHKGEEPAISGARGICNIFFAHCNLRCIYCQNHQISNNRSPLEPFRMELHEVIDTITGMLDNGLTHVGFVSPSHFVPQVKVIISIIRSLGYEPVWVYNSNGYDKPETLRSLEGMIDVYLPDFKYMDHEIAGKFSDATDYPEVASAAVREMMRQKGSVLHLNDDGTASSGIIIRHLVLPGHVNNSLKIIRFIAEELSPKLHLSLMSQYYPVHGLENHPLLYRQITKEEYEMVVREMESAGMENGWVQEFSSSEFYRPDFDQVHPFEG